MISVRVGNFSNFVGTHESNFSLVHAANDKAKTTLKHNDVQHTLVIDASHSLGNLSAESGVVRHAPLQVSQAADTPDSAAEIDVIAAEFCVSPVAKYANSATVLPESIDALDTLYWSDFQNFGLSRHSVQTLRGVSLATLETRFQRFAAGFDSFKLLDDAFADRLSSQLEQIDLVRQSRVLVDSDSAFGGVGQKCVEVMRDELAKVPLVSFAVDDAFLGQRNAPCASTARAMSFVALQEHSSVLVPLSRAAVRGFRANDNRFRSSAVLGAALFALTDAVDSLNQIVTKCDLGSTRNIGALRFSSSAISQGAWMSLTHAIGDADNHWQLCSGTQQQVDAAKVPQSFPPSLENQRVRSMDLKSECATPAQLAATIQTMVTDLGDKRHQSECARESAIELDDLKQTIERIKDVADCY